MRRFALVALVLASLLLASCGPAIMPAAAPQTESGETFVIALPRIVLTFDEQGNPGVEGVALEEIARSLGFALDLSQYRIHEFYPQWMEAANIQHIELRQTGDGIALLVNGALMPSLSFQDGSLQRIADVAPLLGQNGPAIGQLIAKFAPLVQRLGLSVVLKFPQQEGAAEIPYGPDDIKLAQLQPAAVDPSAVAKFEVKYDEQGVPSILGISARDLQSLGLNANVALAPSVLAQLQANNVQHVQLSSRSNGMYMWVNGSPLPAIAWDNSALQNALQVYEQMNPGVPKAYLDLIRTFVPMLAQTDVSVMVHFPVAAGAEPIPATMQ
ncbi:MAG: hypothetical protein MUC34_05560 [Anaerolineae bacterium]|jgi:hypothetical protein|nr:hypothetical protein [Anaerolineae bacterium]